MKQGRNQVNSAKVAGLPTEKAETILTIVANPGATHIPVTDYDLLSSEIKKGLSLDETMKLIEELHLKKRHRDRLDLYIDLLNSFAVAQKVEDLDTDPNSYYNGCSLVITDDKSGKFNLRNPTLIKDVIEFLTGRMAVKLSEIESEIQLPN
ncbi:hypothetical protein ACVWYN_002693 [Pedobacter sp. UYP24]